MEDKFLKEPYSNMDARDLPGAFFEKNLHWAALLSRYPAYVLLSIKHITNYKDVFLLISGREEKAVLKFRDGREYGFDRASFKRPLFILLMLAEKGFKAEVSEKFDRVSFDYGDRKLSLSGPDALGLAYDVFFCNEYAPLMPDEATVVDVGANIGDTPIYFILNGARKVVAFEPYPFSFGIMQENVRANGLEGSVDGCNEGVAGKDGEMELDGIGSKSGGSQLVAVGGGKKVCLVSLKSIVGEHKLKDALLKMDCEGCEYGAILDADRATLRSFKRIMLEFHYGHANLRAKLKGAGFAVSILRRPAYTNNAGWENPHARTGLMLAAREGD